MIKYLILFLVVALTGCQNLNHLTNAYPQNPTLTTLSNGKVVNIRESSKNSKAFTISPTTNESAIMGAGAGITLGLVDTTPDHLYNDYADLYVRDTYGPGCTVVSFELLVQPVWEAKYNCNIDETINGDP